MNHYDFVNSLLGMILGSFCLGLLFMYLLFKYKCGGFAKLSQDLLQKADSERLRLQKELDLHLKQQEFEHRQALEKMAERKMQKLSQKEEKIDQQLAFIDKKGQEIEKKEREFAKLKESLLQREADVEKQSQENIQQLESLAGLTMTEAKHLLFDQFKHEIEQESGALLYRRKKETEKEAEHVAATTLATAINRLSLQTVSEVAVTTVSLPGQEMKGRVIGREGRNIRILEQVTGVNFVVDDTPNTVVISSFDPVRKEIAKIALKELIQDGRIHPTSIEEAVAKAEKKVKEQIREYGQEAALKAGSLSLHPELILLLGKLHFRFSNGQNILSHSVEVSHLMGILAAELGVDTDRSKRIGLLHDIGKALSQEVEGSHALIGQQLALKYGESEEVANGIGCHHEEIPPESIEAILCLAANKISGGRPGARSEAIDHYLKRSAKLEQLCRQFEGVEKAYAMHAGRELRVIVEPEQFDDSATLLLAREIAKKIEKELSYQGKIKVTVIREKRVIEYAS